MSNGFDITHLGPLGRRLFRLISETRPQMLASIAQECIDEGRRALVRESEYFEHKRHVHNLAFENKEPLRQGADLQVRRIMRNEFIQHSVQQDMLNWINNYPLRN